MGLRRKSYYEESNCGKGQFFVNSSLEHEDGKENGNAINDRTTTQHQKQHRLNHQAQANMVRALNSSQGTLEDSIPVLQSIVDLKPKLFVNKMPVIETSRNTIQSMITIDGGAAADDKVEHKQLLAKKLSLPVNYLNIAS